MPQPMAAGFQAHLMFTCSLQVAVDGPQLRTQVARVPSAQVRKVRPDFRPPILPTRPPGGGTKANFSKDGAYDAQKFSDKVNKSFLLKFANACVTAPPRKCFKFTISFEKKMCCQKCLGRRPGRVAHRSHANHSVD